MDRLPSARPLARHLGLPIVIVALVAACGAGAASSSAPASANPAPVDPTPVIPTPSPAAGAYWLRMTTFQAIPPVNLFALAPAVVIDGSGQLIVPGAVDAMFPGPLVMPLFARQVSEAGRATILGWAKELGLLSGKTDFTGGDGIPGGVTGRIELTVNGALITLSGIPDRTGASPQPGSPEAFAELWRRIASLSETLPAELGAERPYVPTAYAVLVGPPPDAQGEQTRIADWPLDVPIADFGGPVANGTYRCGIAEGEDAAALTAAFAKATQITQWSQDPTASATFGLTVRPITGGENPCAEVFGS